MIKDKPNFSTNATGSDQFRTVGSHLNLTNLYVAHEAEPLESADRQRRYRYEPVSGSFWESRLTLRRRFLKDKRKNLLD